MKKISHWTLAGILLISLTMGATARDKQESLKRFTTVDPTISKDATVTGDHNWLIECDKSRAIRLFELPEPGVENCMIIYRAKIKSENVTEAAYLEMWCRFGGRGEFFSRGLEQKITGSNDWATYETPFLLKKGEKPDLIKLNLIVKGSGKVWIKDVELLKAPLSQKR